MAGALLASKLRLPQPRPNLISRTVLYEKIEDGIQSGSQLVLVSAPAGFGKTTFVMQWLRHAQKCSAWLSLDENDNDPVRFLHYLQAAVTDVFPAFSSDANDEPAAGERFSPERYLTGLLNAAGQMEEPAFLVLDDYHLIWNRQVHDTVDFLIANLPPQLYLIIVTREDPPLALSRLRARGQLVEVRLAELQLTDQEAEHFFSQTMNLDLDPDVVRALNGRTEGWVAGLQLAALSLKRQNDPAQFVTSFTGSNRYVLDYLADEVLRDQGELVRQFLLLTSLCDPLNAPLCEAIVQGELAFSRDLPDCQSVLVSLEQNNLFLIPLDDQRGWYRYHHLFADFLRSRLVNTSADRLGELHLRAARWYEHHNFFAEAVKHALAGQDMEFAAQCMEKAAVGTLAKNEDVLFLDWVGQIPANVLQQHPVLSLFSGWALVNLGRLDQAADQLGSLQRADLPPTYQTLLSVVQAQLSWFQGNLEQTIRAMAWVTADQLALPVDPDSAGAIRPQHLFLAAVNFRGEALRMQGRLREARHTFQAVTALLGKGELDPRAKALIGNIHSKLSALHYQWNELEAAEQYIQAGMELLDEVHNDRFTAYACLTLGFLRQAQGRWAEARTQIERLAGLVDRQKHSAEGFGFRAVLARLYTLQGQIDARYLDLAQDWAEDYQIWSACTADQNNVFRVLLPYYDATYAYVLLHLAERDRGNHRKDLGQFLEQLIETCEEVSQQAVQIEALALLAVWRRKQGQREAALASLEKALAIARAEDHVRVFVDVGPAMQFLLAELQPKLSGLQKQYVDKLLSAFPQPLALGEGVAQNAWMVEPLSEREQEVLQLLAEGLLYREIAERLVVTPGTIKTHCNHIYTKLGVDNKTQAVLRARELGLL